DGGGQARRHPRRARSDAGAGHADRDALRSGRLLSAALEIVGESAEQVAADDGVVCRNEFDQFVDSWFIGQALLAPHTVPGSPQILDERNPARSARAVGRLGRGYAGAGWIL